MAEGIMQVSDATFDAEVLKSNIPVLVDFWAPWCGPCKAIGPILEEVSKGYAGKIKFAKCNVDDNPATPGNYGIRAIPTLILFKDGKQADQVVGLADRSRIEQILNKSL